MMTAAMRAAAAAEGPRVQQLEWLQGCREAASAGRVVEEQWMAPRGRSMVGWIEGTRDLTPRRVEFPYRRVPCAGD
jgi:hypothetical protein